MTNVTAWAPLPNAKHIDIIVADVKARPGVWSYVTAPEHPFWIVAWDRAYRAVSDQDRDEAMYAIQNVVKDVTARTAVRALVAWDDCGDILGMSPDAVRALIDTAKDDVRDRALLLLPAVIALRGEEC